MLQVAGHVYFIVYMYGQQQYHLLADHHGI